MKTVYPLQTKFAGGGGGGGGGGGITTSGLLIFKTWCYITPKSATSYDKCSLKPSWIERETF